MLGNAAIAIWCQIDASLRAEHDAWHSGEHLPERLAIPGFLRGRRCRAVNEAAEWPYFILYEVRDASVMTSPAYLERLNSPTPWSRKIFASCRLSRTLCRVVESRGRGVGGMVLTLRDPGEVPLLELLSLQGVTAAHRLERDASVERPRTSEESLRAGGGDASVEGLLVVEGHDLGALALRGERYRLSHALTP
ncbi:MAG TPA: hypothetical protein VFZ74_07060 [Burkholderiales bacterium]